MESELGAPEPHDPGHDTWFRRQVELSVKAADDPQAEWLSHEEVKRQSAIERAIWLGKSTTAKKTSD